MKQRGDNRGLWPLLHSLPVVNAMLALCILAEQSPREAAGRSIQPLVCLPPRLVRDLWTESATNGQFAALLPRCQSDPCKHCRCERRRLWNGRLGLKGIF